MWFFQGEIVRCVVLFNLDVAIGFYFAIFFLRCLEGGVGAQPETGADGGRVVFEGEGLQALGHVRKIK